MQLRINYKTDVSESLEDVSVNREDIEISEVVDYPFNELVNAYNKFNQDRGTCRSLNDMVQNNPSGILWNFDSSVLSYIHSSVV